MDTHLQEHPHRSLSTPYQHTHSMLSPLRESFDPSQTPSFKRLAEGGRSLRNPCPLGMASVISLREQALTGSITLGHLYLVPSICEKSLHPTLSLRNRQLDTS